MKWISRSILVLMLAAGGYVVAFGPRPHAQVPSGSVTVTYWEKWTGSEADAMRAIVRDFNNTVGARRHIYVEYLSLSNVQYKTLAATAGGVPPDIAGLWTAQVTQYALQGAAMPLNDLAAQHDIHRDDYKPIFWDMCSYRGNLISLPTTPAVVALHYNKTSFYQAADKLRSLGLDPTRAPRTLDEFDRYAQALDVPAADGKHLQRAGYFTMDSGWYITATNVWFGGHWWDDATQTYTLMTAPNIAAFEWIAGYSRRMGADAFMDFKSGLGGFSSPTNPFISGTVAMVQQGPWMGNYILTYRPDMSQAIVPLVLEPFLPRVLRPFNYDWAAAPFPSAVPGQKDVSYNESDVLMIPRGAQHPREAFEFIAYMQRPLVMEKLCRLTYKPSPLKHASDNWMYAHPNPYIDVFDRLAASPNARSIDQTPIFLEASHQIDIAAQETYLLQKTPTEALSEAQSRIDARLKRYEQQEGGAP